MFLSDASQRRLMLCLSPINLLCRVASVARNKHRAEKLQVSTVFHNAAVTCGERVRWKFGVEWKWYRTSSCREARLWRGCSCSVSRPACLSQPVKEKKMNRFPPAYGISTGAPIKQLASAALCTYRKQLILIASCHCASNLDPCQQLREDSFPISHTFFSRPSLVTHENQ